MRQCNEDFICILMSQSRWYYYHSNLTDDITESQKGGNLSDHTDLYWDEPEF